MDIYRPDVLKRVAIFGVIFIIAAIIANYRWNYIYFHYHFNGKVDSVRYGDKGTAIIIVNGKEYVLDDKWSYDARNLSELVSKGDSIVKKEDSLKVAVFKPNGKIIIR